MRKTYGISALLLALLTVFLILCSCGSSSEGTIPDPSDSFYVYDEAGVLDSELEDYIVGKNADLYKKCGGQIVVACVRTTGTKDIADYAHEMFNKWGVGSKKKNNGILILLSIDEDDYWVLQGKGLEDLLQSGTLKLMLDDRLEPYFAKKQYGDGVRSLFDALVNEFEQIYSVTIEQLPVQVTETPASSQSVPESGLWKAVTTVSGIIVGVTVLILLITVVIVAVVTVLMILGSVFSATSGGGGTFRSPFRGGININPHSFRPSGTYHNSGGFTFGGSSHRSGGFHSGGSSHRSGGFTGGSHHSGGGGSSRGGGAGRR